MSSTADGPAGGRRLAGLAGEIAGLVLLPAAACLWHDRADTVRQFQASRLRQGTADLIRNDDDLLRYDAGAATPMLGKDAAVYDALRTNCAPGGPVRVYSLSERTKGGRLMPLESACKLLVDGRTQRLWLALVPQYKLAEDSQFIICPRIWIDKDYRYDGLRLAEDQDGPVDHPRLLTDADYGQVFQYRTAMLGRYTVLAKGEHLALLKREGGAP
ncbi:MAG: hypothetical protein ACE15C_04540 [Phycisphaerae bacterium]